MASSSSAEWCEASERRLMLKLMKHKPIGNFLTFLDNQGELGFQKKFFGYNRFYGSNQKFMGPIKNFNPRPPRVEN